MKTDQIRKQVRPYPLPIREAPIKAPDPETQSRQEVLYAPSLVRGNLKYTSQAEAGVRGYSSLRCSVEHVAALSIKREFT